MTSSQEKRLHARLEEFLQTRVRDVNVYCLGDTEVDVDFDGTVTFEHMDRLSAFFKTKKIDVKDVNDDDFLARGNQFIRLEVRNATIPGGI